MWFRLFADVVSVMHVLFVLFVVLGSLVVLRCPRAVWLHAPALLWGVIVEWAGLLCPLTPLENRLRVLGGESGYGEDFLSHWLRTVLHPEFLTRGHQVALGTSVLMLNIGLYVWMIRRRKHESGTSSISAS
jgi:hypothetical protein